MVKLYFAIVFSGNIDEIFIFTCNTFIYKVFIDQIIDQIIE